MNSMKITAFIVDDEPRAQEVLKQLLKEYCPRVEVLGMAQSAIETIQDPAAHVADILFMDINLGRENCFELLENFDLSKSRVIFTTAHNEYALRAFDYNALHYLLKPIEPSLLIEAVDRLFRSKSGVEVPLAEKDLSAVFLSRIALPNLHGYELIEVTDIIRCEGDGAYTHVVTRFGERKLVSKPLKYFEDQLNPVLFFRIHKKHIINLKEMIKCTREKVPGVTMSNGDELTVSWRARAKFFEKLRESTAF